MKDGIHPDYHEITILMTDGTSYKTRSTYSKEGDTLRLEIDPKSHPAWTGGQQRLLDTGGPLGRLKRGFPGLGGKEKTAPPPPAPPRRNPPPFPARSSGAGWGGRGRGGGGFSPPGF